MAMLCTVYMHVIKMTEEHHYVTLLHQLTQLKTSLRASML